MEDVPCKPRQDHNVVSISLDIYGFLRRKIPTAVLAVQGLDVSKDTSHFYAFTHIDKSE
jgi:hypothetical protein